MRSKSNCDNLDDQLSLLPSFQDSFRWLLESFQGLSCYRVHPFRRQSPPYIEIWREGQTRLLAHKGFDEESLRIAIIVPSFINDYYIGDLLPQRSLLARLAQYGINSAIIDWGCSLDETENIGMRDYCRRLVSLSRDMVSRYRCQPVLIGHCLGGLMSLSAGLEDCADIKGVVLVSSPWDFSDIKDYFSTTLLEKSLCHSTIRNGFLWRNAISSLDRFRDFGRDIRRMKNSDNVFVAVEDWLSSGFDMSMNLSSDLARLCGKELSLENLWWLDREPPLSRLQIPCSMIVPLKDKVTPPQRSLGVIECLNDVRVFPFDTGHLGAVAGGHINQTLEVVIDNMERATANVSKLVR